MSELILHHYPLSPFSEKIRAMLGYTGLGWQSVIVSERPPRPLLAPLAGGYRKIPVAQIGADVFCDTRTISREIARLSGRPELSLEHVSKAEREFVEDTDLEVFLACILSAGSFALLRKVVKESSLLELGRVLLDRISMGRKARVKAMTPGQARRRVRRHMAHMENLLTRDFLFGSQPSIADFSAYHSLWFLCDLAEKPWLDDFPIVAAWMERMRAFGHGQPVEISAEQALVAAAEAIPRPLSVDSGEPLLGQPVSIAPVDYGREPVTGVLVGSHRHGWVVSRKDDELGDIHVHLPRQGFVMQPLANQPPPAS
ncbi:MAG: glutathione S-transferase family protein [Alcanivorax sp.]|nr:glutathione S-transferase family protein [Alcanivorax sp.]